MKKWMIFGLMMLGLTAHAEDTLQTDISNLQHAWAKANYQTAKDQQESSFKALVDTAHQLSERHPDSNDAKIWEAIVLSGYAKSMGPLHPINALKAAEQARDLLLGTIARDPSAQHGSAYTTLGSLYFKVPGWPIGFGDKKKAQQYLEKALQINPSGMDSNFFYADYLYGQAEYEDAVAFYQKALQAPPRPGREDADAGRRKEVEAGLKQAESKVRK